MTVDPIAFIPAGTLYVYYIYINICGWVADTFFILVYVGCIFDYPARRKGECLVWGYRPAGALNRRRLERDRKRERYGERETAMERWSRRGGSVRPEIACLFIQSFRLLTSLLARLYLIKLTPPGVRTCKL